MGVEYEGEDMSVWREREEECELAATIPMITDGDGALENIIFASMFVDA